MLDSLAIRNLRCFSKLSLGLTVPREQGDGWTIFVGENGVGKSTLLQSIVLATLDPRPVTSLVPDPWTLVRQAAGGTAEEAAITLTSSAGASATRTIVAHENAYVEGDSSALGLPLLLAFSARRRIARPGELPSSENLELERVRGLFRSDHPLLTVDPFAAFDGADARKLAAVVARVITSALDEDETARLFPLVDRVELRGKTGVTKSKQLLQQRRFLLRYGDSYQARVGVEDLSDGYQAMLAVVLEILFHAAITNGEVPNPSDLEAVVLIDEIEAHLHPRWQRTVVPLLRAAFPRCQFVVTTHSPLVVASANPGEVRVLEVGQDGAVVSEVLEDRLAMLGANRIYDEVFGVPRVAPPALVEAEREYLAQVARGEVAPAVDQADLVEAAWADAQRGEDK